MKITNHTILITGGTSGIGLGFAKKFTELGNRVVICGRRKERLEQIKAKHKTIETIICDVTNAEQRTRLYQSVVDRFPKTDVLINNAGIQFDLDLTQSVDLKQIAQEIETNLVAPIHLSSLFAPHLAAQTEAVIINISSGLAYVPIASMPLYCATKAALHSLTLSLRHQLRATSIKVFEIAPPSVDTELGSERRSEKAPSHGGMPVDEFVGASISAIESDTYEAPIGPAKLLKEKPEELFAAINPGG